MKRVILTVLASAAMATASGAGAQPVPAPALALTAPEQAALQPLKAAVDARDWATAANLVPAARAAARSADARYVLGRLQHDIAVGTQNRQGLSDAITFILDSGKASPVEQTELLKQQAGVAYDVGNLSLAEAALQRALRTTPNDADALSMLGQVNRNRGNTTEGLTLFQRGLRAADLSGRPLPESRYRLALAMAEQAGQRPATLELSRQLVAAYPTSGNWRDALINFRTVGTVDAAQSLDAFRLARAAGALTGERDYLAAATALDQAGLPAEAKAVIDEGVSRRMISATMPAARTLLTAVAPRITRERTALTGQMSQARAAAGTATQARTVADTLLAHGRYAEAAELYRLALTRTGEDAGLLNTRLGIALAMANQNAEAEAAFRAVDGPRAELAALWATWLTRRPAG